MSGKKAEKALEHYSNSEHHAASRQCNTKHDSSLSWKASKREGSLPTGRDFACVDTATSLKLSKSGQYILL